ncbi:carbohydrate ABC transporter permease [Dictyobacter alpinus]|nr:sugar ABC transporter permease [Dictyobacter alpinus]
MPALLLFTIFVIYPTVSSVYYAMTDWNGINADIHFNGLTNFQRLLTDRDVWNGLKVTVVFAIAVMILQNTLALVLALALNSFRDVKGFGSVRVFLLIPNLISGLAVGYIWSYMYNPMDGTVNSVLSAVGLSGFTRDWLGDGNLALGSIIFTSIWQSVGFAMIIFFAGLQTVPQELYEAADMDGAGSWQRFRRITFPLIAPAFTVNVVLTLIGSLKVFDIIFTMTKGGPGTATESILVHVYTQAFVDNNFGYAGAISLVSSIFIFLLSIIALQFLRRREVTY